MKLIITDVSVLFDLFHLQILPEFFALDRVIYTTNFVYNEIIRSEQKEVFEVLHRSGKFNIISITEEEESEIRSFPFHYSLKSFPDQTMLWKSYKLNGTLLTCD